MEDKNLNTSQLEEESKLNAGETVKNTEQLSDEELHGENLTDRVKVLSPGMTVLKRFFRSKLSVIGLVTIIVLFIFSFLGPIFSPWGETEVDLSGEGYKNLVSEKRIEYVIEENGEQVKYFAYEIDETPPDANINNDPSLTHWLGTDNEGRDIFTRLMYGGRVSLTIGFVVIIIETLLGVLLGGLAGYFGGWVDQLIMRIVDILYCIPQIPIMLILSATLDGLAMIQKDPLPIFDLTGIAKLYFIMMILCLIGWAGTARLVRGQILSLREQEFMLAAKCSGLSTRRKIFKHLIPNVLPQLIVSMTLGLGSIILTEATLGYLGLGAPLNSATWGGMIQAANDYEKLSYYPNFWMPPGICITLAILAFNFVGDGLRDAFDPKMKR